MGTGDGGDHRLSLTVAHARDYTPDASRALVPGRFHDASEVSTQPVDDGPSPAGAERAGNTRKRVRPAP